MTGWKTLAFNGAIGLAALLADLLSLVSSMDWRAFVPPEFVPYAVLAMGMANILLRHVTQGPAAWRLGTNK